MAESGVKSAKAQFVVKYNNSDDTDSLTNATESGTYTDNANGSADTISFTLNNQKNKWMHGYFPGSNDYLKVWIKTQSWYGKGNDKLYCGKFVIDQISLTGGADSASKMELEGIATPVKASFSVTQKNKKWKKSTLETIATKIAKSAGLKVVYHADKISTDEMTQSGTDMEFLFSTAKKYGVGMKIFAKKILLYDIRRYEKKKAKVTIKKSQVEEYDFQNKIMARYNAVQLKNDDIEYSFKIPNTKGNRKLFLTDAANSIKNAEKIAKAALRESRRENYKVTLVITGSTKIYSTMNIKLEGFGKENGKYFVDKAEHSIDGAYTTTIEAHKVVTNF